MAKRSIKALQNRIDTENSKRDGGVSSTGIFYPHWKLPKDGVTKARFIEDPDQDNDLIFYKEYKEHVLNIGDEVVRIPCLKNGNIKTPCPICELSKKYYDAEEKDKGKYYYRDLYLLLRGIVTKDGLEYNEDDKPATGMTKVFKFSYQLSTALKASLGQFEEGDEPWDLDEGYDFQIVKTINKTPDGDQAKYDAGSTFVRKPSAIEEEWKKNVPDEPLSALIPEIPSYDEAVEILHRHLKSLTGDTGGDDTESESDIEAKIAKQRAKKRDAAKAAEDEKEAALDRVEAEEAELEAGVAEAAKVDDEPEAESNPLDGIDLDDDDGDIDIISKLKS